MVKLTNLLKKLIGELAIILLYVLLCGILSKLPIPTALVLTIVISVIIETIYCFRNKTRFSFKSLFTTMIKIVIYTLILKII